MSAFWHPLSAVYLDEPRVLASPSVLRMVLAGEGRALVRYAGDRMWPTLRHGQALQVTPIAGGIPEEGDVVLVAEGGVVDLLRVARADGPVALVADAEAFPARAVAERDLLGRASVAKHRRGARAWRRLRLDLGEAWAGRPESSADPAASVRDKYDAQATFYARSEAATLEPDFARRIATAVARGGRILVAGSGTGREAFALEAMGYEVIGVDFAPRMVEEAQAAARARGSRVVFVSGDLRDHREPDGSLAAVIFTYEVYSFVPSAAARIAILSRCRRALAPGGVLFLSARRRSRLSDRAILAVQWLVGRRRRPPSAWGDSHTRWLDGSGRIRRSFVHLFTPRGLDAEVRRAGFVPVDWIGGHGLYRVRGGRVL